MCREPLATLLLRVPCSTRATTNFSRQHSALRTRDITYGTALGAAQLNATANVPGTVSYSPPPGTVLNAGNNQPLTATFTPTDTANYNPATATVNLTVLKATPVITWAIPPEIIYG